MKDPNSGLIAMADVALEKDSPYKIPTIAELGYPDAVVPTSRTLYVPAGTPDAVIEILCKDFEARFNDPEVQEKFDSSPSLAQTILWTAPNCTRDNSNPMKTMEKGLRNEPRRHVMIGFATGAEIRKGGVGELSGFFTPLRTGGALKLIVTIRKQYFMTFMSLLVLGPRRHDEIYIIGRAGG
jgi:hypothetical protein